MDNLKPSQAPNEKSEPPKGSEKKIFKAGIIDAKALLDAQSKDIGDTRMTESKEDRSKNRVSRFFTRIWKHNLAQDYYRHKEISKVREDILRTGNLYEGEQISGGDGANPEHSKVAMQAIIDKFTSDYSDEILKEEEKESKREGDAQVNNKIKDLIKSYASSGMSDEEFKEKKKGIIEVYNPNYADETNLYADNLLDIAHEVKDSINHSQSMEAMDFDVQLTLGKARESLDTEAKKTTFDKILSTMGKTKLGTLALNVGAGAVVAVGYSLAKFIALKAGVKGAKWFGFGAGLAVGGAIEGAKESVRLNRERAQHIRESAKGVKFTEEDMKRREEMEKNRYQTKGATEIISNLDNHLNIVSRGNLSPTEIREIMTNLSDLEARVRIGGERKVDLISYDGFEKVEKDRTSLLVKAAELKSALRNANLSMNGSFDSNLETLTNTQSSDFIEGEEGLESKDKLFRKLKRKKVALKFAQTVLVGGAISFAFQEVSSLVTKEDGVIEGAAKSIRNHFSDEHVQGEGMSRTTTSIEALRRWAFNDGPRMPMGAGSEFVVNGSHLHLPEGVNLVQHADGHGYDLIADGKIISGVDLDAYGKLTPESLKLLHGAGIYPDVSTVGEHTTETVTRTADEYMKQNPAGTEHVHFKDWMGNNTEMYEDPNNPGHRLGADLNELRTHWTGINGTGVDANGDYVMTVANMTNDGSFQGGLSVAAQEQMAAGKLEAILSVTKEGQHHVFRIPILSDGSFKVDHNSIPGQMLYSVGADGHAQFDGAFLQIAHPDGVAADGLVNEQLLGALEGTGNPHNITETIVNDTQATHIRFDIPLDSEIEPPIPIPIVPRRPLERGEYAQDQDKNKPGANSEKGIKGVKDVQSKNPIDGAVDPLKNNPNETVTNSTWQPDRGFSAANSNESTASTERQKIYDEVANLIKEDKSIPPDLLERYRSEKKQEISENKTNTENITDDSINIPILEPEPSKEEKPIFIDKIDNNENLSLGEVSDDEYNSFVNNNIVSEIRLKDIAEKVKNQRYLTEKEQAIFTGKTTDINNIIAGS